jgi:hypothetical protein
MPKTFRVTLNYPDGNTMFIGTITAEEIGEPPAKLQRPPAVTNGPTGQSDGGEKMTDPQKRYLFRLLGAQGIEGKKAEEHLKSYFRVARLADIPKSAASQYIDQMVKDKQDAAS